METIKCKECGKDLSSKAEICPNCGVRVKKKGIISKAFRFFEVIGVLIVIGLVVFFGYQMIRNILNENRRKSYIGEWTLQSNIESVIYKKESGLDEENNQLYYEFKIIIDDKLKIEDENINFGIGLSSCDNFKNDKEYTERCDEVPVVVRLNNNDKVSAINFVATDGENYLLCFEKNGDTLKQRSCKGANSDESNDSLYSMNGGIDEDFGIVYKKVK